MPNKKPTKSQLRDWIQALHDCHEYSEAVNYRVAREISNFLKEVLHEQKTTGN